MTHAEIDKLLVSLIRDYGVPMVGEMIEWWSKGRESTNVDQLIGFDISHRLMSAGLVRIIRGKAERTAPKRMRLQLGYGVTDGYLSAVDLDRLARESL